MKTALRITQLLKGTYLWDPQDERTFCQARPASLAFTVIPPFAPHGTDSGQFS